MELKAHALTGFSYRQLHEGVGRGVGGRKDKPWQMVVAEISPINYPLALSLQQALGSEQTEAFDPEVIGEEKKGKGPWQGA